MPSLTLLLTPARKAALFILAVSVLALLGSISVMAQRVSEYHAGSDQKFYMFSPVNGREFIYADRPVTILDEQGPSGTAVIVRYGDEALRLHATIEPGPEQLPNLIRHAQWMKVLRFVAFERGQGQRPGPVPGAGGEAAEVQPRDRLVVVVRNPPRGTDPDTWGQVWRKQWTFDLYEFKPEGGFHHQRLGYPTHRRNEPPKDGELAEGTWEFYAALLVMPAGSKPTPKFTGDALKAMGWTLPAAAAMVLLLMGSLAALLAPSRRRI
jgi:hypothetical protein